MSNIKLLFIGTERSNNQSEPQCYVNDYNELYLCLDKSTAIRPVKELKKQINFLENDL